MANIEKIDTALAKYYASLNITYKNNDGIGKFAFFCDDNGFEDDDIEEEVEGTADNCSFLEFDEDFPLHSPITDEDKRAEEIFRIVKFCAINGEPPSFEQEFKFNLNDINFSIPSNITSEVKEKYSKQLTCLGDIGNKEEGLMYLFAMGKLNDYPLLTYFVDTYTKEKMDEFIKTDQSETMTVLSWASSNEYMKSLTKSDQKKKKLKKVEDAVTGYCHRVMPRLQFQPLNKVDSKIKSVATYLVVIARFIKSLITTKSADVPFQCDLLFAMDSKAAANAADVPDSDSDDDDDDDDDDSDDEKQEKHDHIGDVWIKFKKAKCAYFPSKSDERKISLDVDDNKEDALRPIERQINERWNDFRSELSKNKKKWNATYPKKKRFGILVDKRNNKDELTFFEQYGPFDSMPDGHVPEWYVESGRKCLIPYGHEHNGDHIKATDPLDGQLMTFSFHVETNDEIRCYIIWNAQTMRFEGEHIKKLMPLLFVDNEENKKFVAGKEINKMIKEFDENARDIKFNAFYKAMTAVN